MYTVHNKISSEINTVHDLGSTKMSVFYLLYELNKICEVLDGNMQCFQYLMLPHELMKTKDSINSIKNRCRQTNG